jgi:hypothetical protein
MGGMRPAAAVRAILGHRASEFFDAPTISMFL